MCSLAGKVRPAWAAAGLVQGGEAGAAGFNIMERQTAARERLAISVIVFAEGAWTMEELNELQTYGTTFGTAQGEIRWDLVARGLGCEGEYVERIEDLDIAEALRIGEGKHVCSDAVVI